jgi:hypothetical protein
MSADNQQERLIGWIVGFTEGEGCFSIGFIKQPQRKSRKGYQTGIQVWHEFAITQGARSLSALEKIKTFFGVGNIYINKRYDNHREHLYRYVVRRREDLLKVIIPFFENNEMHTIKKQQFERFLKVLTLVQDEKHLTWEGLEEIIKIAETMNFRKSKTPLIRILRDHTPKPVSNQGKIWSRLHGDMQV